MSKNMPVVIGHATITDEIAVALGDIQSNNNDMLSGMISSLSTLQNFLIGLNGSGTEAQVILDHLSGIREVEDTLKSLIYQKETSDDR